MQQMETPGNGTFGVMGDAAIIVGLIRNLVVPEPAVELVGQTTVVMISGDCSIRRTNIITHIDQSRNCQAPILCESLGCLLYIILHLMCTIANVYREYRDAEQSL